jgi:hypothetical protein
MLGCLYVALNLHMYKDMKFVLSDYLAVFLCAALTAALARRHWIGTAVAASCLCLVKAIFFPFGLLLSVVLAVRGHRKGAALIAACLLVVNLGWIERNLALFGAAGDGRDGLALSTREVFDHMTPAEHRAAWLWWLRGPGAHLAKANMPVSAWERHEWDAPDGFYLDGQVTQPERIIAELMADGALDRTAAETKVKRVVAGEIVSDLPDYLMTMPLLLIALGSLVRARRWDAMIALTPGLWSLVVYPAISLNIPRYQYTAVTTLALAAGLVWQLHGHAVAARALGGISRRIGADQKTIEATVN